MWNSTLKRKTPLRSGKPLRRANMARGGLKPGKAGKPKPPLRQATPKRAAETSRYREDRKWWLALPENIYCGACGARHFGIQWSGLKLDILTRGWTLAGVARRASEVHHSRGRIGRLLLDRRFWIAVCIPCHDWIHDNRRAAEALELVCPGRKWNVFPAPGEPGFATSEKN